MHREVRTYLDNEEKGSQSEDELYFLRDAASLRLGDPPYRTRTFLLRYAGEYVVAKRVRPPAAVGSKGRVDERHVKCNERNAREEQIFAGRHMLNQWCGVLDENSVDARCTYGHEMTAERQHSEAQALGLFSAVKGLLSEVIVKPVELEIKYREKNRERCKERGSPVYGRNQRRIARQLGYARDERVDRKRDHQVASKVDKYARKAKVHDIVATVTSSRYRRGEDATQREDVCQGAQR